MARASAALRLLAVALLGLISAAAAAKGVFDATDANFERAGAPMACPRERARARSYLLRWRAPRRAALTRGAILSPTSFPCAHYPARACARTHRGRPRLG